MKTFIVAYDLHTTGQNYTGLISKIKSYGTWCHLQGSVWIIKSNDTAESIRDNLLSCLDKNDKLMVVQLEGEAAWFGYNSKVSSWIREVA